MWYLCSIFRFQNPICVPKCNPEGDWFLCAALVSFGVILGDPEELGTIDLFNNKMNPCAGRQTRRLRNYHLNCLAKTFLVQSIGSITISKQNKRTSHLWILAITYLSELGYHAMGAKTCYKFLLSVYIRSGLGLPSPKPILTKTIKMARASFSYVVQFYWFSEDGLPKNDRVNTFASLPPSLSENFQPMRL